MICQRCEVIISPTLTYTPGTPAQQRPYPEALSRKHLFVFRRRGDEFLPDTLGTRHAKEGGYAQG